MKTWLERLGVVFGLTLLIAVGLPGADPASADSAEEIDAAVDEALAKFYEEIDGAEKLSKSADGLLVFPKVYKAGIGIGGEYGEGALRVGGETVDYYSTAAGSFGLQLGAQAKTVVILFLHEDALESFRKGEGWKAGVDGSIAVVDIGAGGSIDSENVKDPILGFVLDQKGLMANLTLEGSKYTKLDRKKEKPVNGPADSEAEEAGESVADESGDGSREEDGNGEDPE